MTVLGKSAKGGLPAAVASPPGDPVAAGITLVRPSAAKPRRLGRIRIPRLARRVVGPVLVLIGWQLACAAGVFTSVEVASPIAVLDAARELWSQDVLQSNMLI